MKMLKTLSEHDYGKISWILEKTETKNSKLLPLDHSCFLTDLDDPNFEIECPQSSE